MFTLRLLQSGLLLHIIGITVLVGSTLVSYIVQQRFLKEYKVDKQRGLVLMPMVSKLSRLAAAGLGLQIVSGITMIVATGDGFGQQLWFQIKMVLVLIIIAGSVFLNRRLLNRLHLRVLNDMMNQNKTQEIGMLARWIRYTQLFLLAFFLLIFVLSIFRFN